MTDKTEATRLADALDDSLCPMCHQAAALLRRWPEGEPCVWVDEVSLAWLAKRLEDHATITTTLAKQRALNRAVPLYAAPPAKPDFGSAAHALDDALVSAHLGTLESFPNPKAALKALEAWNDQLALDPAVSPEAAKLHERIAELEAERSALRTALEFASAAVEDAIYTEDGIDGQDGERLLYIFREALERGTFDKVRYGDLPPMLLEVRNNALEAALEQARVALENVDMAPLVRDALRAIEEMRK